jgi:DNA-binding MarR family transcriptional regulator
VDLLQLRILVVIASLGRASLGDVAAAAQIHLSRASRACDRLVAKSLIERVDDPENRRSLRLTLSPAGERIVRRVMRARRSSITSALEQMRPRQRTQLTNGLRAFSEAVGEPADLDLWAVGWLTSEGVDE